MSLPEPYNQGEPDWVNILDDANGWNEYTGTDDDASDDGHAPDKPNFSLQTHTSFTSKNSRYQSWSTFKITYTKAQSPKPYTYSQYHCRPRCPCPELEFLRSSCCPCKS